MKKQAIKRNINAQKKKIGEGSSVVTRMENTPDGDSIYDSVKTSKDWKIEQEEKELKTSRAGVLTLINTLLSDNKAVERLFAGDFNLQKKETSKNEKKLKESKQALKALDMQLDSLKVKKAGKQDNWRPLYEQVG